MSTIKHTFCRICEPACPLKAEVDDTGEVVSLQPSPDNPIGGIPCNKGLNFINVHKDPDRLNWPMKRVNEKSAAAEFERVEWDTALAEIAQKLQALQAKYGNDSVAIYGGNPLAFDSRSMLLVGQLAASMGSSMFFGAGTQDCTNKFAASTAMYANVANFIPDLTYTDYLLCIGANPKVSHWTSISVPNDSGKILKDIKARGGKVTFVNPRRIESSTDATGDTLLIKPDTDAFFLAALSNEIRGLGGFNDAHMRKHGKNVDEYLRFIDDWSAEKVEAVTGIAAAQIKQVAADMVAAKAAACYLSTGVNQGRQGTLSFWLSEMLNFATGNLGKEGGTYKPVQLAPSQPTPVVAQELDSPFGKIPMGGASMMPGVLLADYIESGAIHAVVCIAGNPLLSMNGEQKLAEAFEKLDLLACIDISPNLTTEYADYVLPVTDWLERADITGYPLLTGAQLIPSVQYTDAVTPPKYERRSDWWVLSRLFQELNVPSPLDDPDHREGFNMIDMLLAGHGLSIDTIKEQPYQIALLEQPAKDSLYQTNVLHEDGKIDCYPESFGTYGLYERFETIWSELEQEPADVLKLISMRTPQMHNSWMANSSTLRGGGFSDNRLRMSPDDAAERGLVDGDRIKVFNDNGEIECRLELRPDLRAGAVSMTHGYGHSKASRLSIASKKPGENCNRLFPTGPETYEPISHMSWMCGVPVTVERVA